MNVSKGTRIRIHIDPRSKPSCEALPPQKELSLIAGRDTIWNLFDCVRLKHNPDG